MAVEDDNDMIVADLSDESIHVVQKFRIGDAELFNINNQEEHATAFILSTEDRDNIEVHLVFLPEAWDDLFRALHEVRGMHPDE